MKANGSNLMDARSGEDVAAPCSSHCYADLVTFGSLFAGIGGFDLGLERAGYECRWQVEIDDYANRILAKHWPHVRRWPDVRTWPQHDTEPVDIICGGFPCQDISHAGQKQGIDGDRSGLWGEFRRIIGDLRPAVVLVENVAALLVRGMDRVCGELAESGYDAEWDVIPASAVGAPHIRERVFIVAWDVAKAEVVGRANVLSANERPARGEGDALGNGGAVLADTESERGELRKAERERQGRPSSGGGDVANANGKRSLRTSGYETEPCGDESKDGIPERDGSGGEERGHEWSVEPDVGRVANGVPDRVDRLRGLGNAVVPQVAEWLGYRVRAVKRRVSA